MDQHHIFEAAYDCVRRMTPVLVVFVGATQGGKVDNYRICVERALVMTVAWRQFESFERKLSFGFGLVELTIVDLSLDFASSGLCTSGLRSARMLFRKAHKSFE